MKYDFTNLSILGTDIDRIIDDICEQAENYDLPVFEKYKYRDSYMYEGFHEGYFYKSFCNSEIQISYDMYRNILGWVFE